MSPTPVYESGLSFALLPEPIELPNLSACRDELQAAVAEWLEEHPMKSLSSFLVACSLVFYVAERGVNAKINTFWDALYYITTCASVGYADVFAQTQLGKTVASLVFTVGPAMCARAMDKMDRRPPQDQQDIVDRLDGILVELRRLNTAAR